MCSRGIMKYIHISRLFWVYYRGIKMKTCILSMQMVDNYGSLLQAYGLKRIIELMGSSVEFINIKKIEEDYCLLGNRVEHHSDESDEKTRLQKFFDRDLLVRLSNKRTDKQFTNKCNEFRKHYLNIENVSDNYDLCIIGSDEVFNCLNAGWWGYTSQLFGNVQEADTIITYAASCGATKYGNLTNAIKESIGNAFKNISSFSVRDANTYEFVESFGIKEIDRHFDPVLIYDFDKEVEDAELPSLPKHYCVIYSYPYRFYKRDEIDKILDFCRSYNLTPVAIQGGQTWCKKFIACSPFECLKVFQNADFVITDTFHGTIFSAKYANKFAVITRESNYNKLSDLVKGLGIEKHWIDNMSQLESVYSLEKEYESIKKVLETERSCTYRYLERYIDGE